MKIFETNIWRSCFKAYELIKIERTTHKEFAELQHRVRNQRHTTPQKLEPMRKEDISFLNTNCKANKTDIDYDSLSLHIFYKNAEVNEQNLIALERLEQNTKMEIITARDSFAENCPISEKTKLGILTSLEQKNSRDTGQLCYKLKLSVSCRVAITTNINVKDGLVNGAMGTIRHFTKTNSGEIHIIWIDFDNVNVGKQLRKIHHGLYKNNPAVEQQWTPIFAICRHFQMGAKGKGIRKLYEVKE